MPDMVIIIIVSVIIYYYFSNTGLNCGEEKDMI